MVLSNSFHTFVENAFGNKRGLLRSTYTAQVSLNGEKIEERCVFGGNISEEFLQKADSMLKRGGHLEVVGGWNAETRNEIHENNRFQRALASLVESDEFALMDDKTYSVSVATRSGLRGLNVVKFNEEATKLLDELNAIPSYKEPVEKRREMHTKKIEEGTEELDSLISQVITKCETAADRELTNEEIGRLTKMVYYYNDEGEGNPWMAIDIGEFIGEMIGGEEEKAIKKSYEPAIAAIEAQGIERPSFDGKSAEDVEGDDESVSDEEIDEAFSLLKRAGYSLEEDEGDEVLDVELAGNNGNSLMPTKVKFNPDDDPSKEPVTKKYTDFNRGDKSTKGQVNTVKKVVNKVVKELDDKEKKAVSNDGGEPYDLQINKEGDGEYKVEVTGDNGKKIKDVDVSIDEEVDATINKSYRKALRKQKLREFDNYYDPNDKQGLQLNYDGDDSRIAKIITIGGLAFPPLGLGFFLSDRIANAILKAVDGDEIEQGYATPWRVMRQALKDVWCNIIDTVNGKKKFVKELGSKIANAITAEVEANGKFYGPSNRNKSTIVQNIADTVREAVVSDIDIAKAEEFLGEGWLENAVNEFLGTRSFNQNFKNVVSKTKKGAGPARESRMREAAEALAALEQFFVESGVGTCTWIGDDILEVTCEGIASERDLFDAINSEYAGNVPPNLQADFVDEEEGFFTYDLSLGA